MKNRVQFILLWAIVLNIPTHHVFLGTVDQQEDVSMNPLAFSQNTSSLEDFLHEIIDQMNTLLKNHIASPENMYQLQSALDQATTQANTTTQSPVIHDLLEQAYAMLKTLKINMKLFYKTINKSSRRLKQDIIIADSNNR